MLIFRRRTAAERALERGSGLIHALVLAIICGGLCAGMVTTVTSRARLARKSLGVTSATSMADSGLALARVELLQNKDIDGGGIGAASGKLNGGTYSVSCTTIDATHWRLVSVGKFDKTSQSVESVISITTSNNGALNAAVFGTTSVSIGGGAQTDMYDSALGAYANQAVNTDSKSNKYALATGNVGSNGAITTNGTGVFIHGDAVPGVGKSVTVNGNGIVSGSTVARKTNYTPPAINTAGVLNASTGAPLAAVINYATLTKSGNCTVSSGGDVTIKNGGKLTIPAGSYWFNSITVSNGGQIVCNGAVKLYVDSDIDATGGSIVNSTATASNLKIYCLGDSSMCHGGDVRISAKNGFCGLIYGPNCDVTLTGGGQFYGGIVCNNFTESGGAYIHADKSLMSSLDTSTATKTLKQVSWRRVGGN